MSVERSKNEKRATENVTLTNPPAKSEQATTRARNDEFNVKTAETFEVASKIIEVGFEYVCEVDGVKLSRQRK